MVCKPPRNACCLVKGPGHIGKPREIWDNAVQSDSHHLSTSRSIMLPRTSVPGELRIASHAPSLAGLRAFG